MKRDRRSIIAVVLGFAAVATLLSAVLYRAGNISRKALEDVFSAHEHAAVRSSKIHIVAASLWEMRWDVANYALLSDAEKDAIRKKSPALAHKTQEAFDQAISTRENAEAQSHAKLFRDDFQIYLANRQSYFNMVDEGKLGPAMRYRAEKVTPFAKVCTQSVSALAEIIGHSLKAEIDDANRLQEARFQELVRLSALGIGSLLAFFGFVFTLMRRFSRREALTQEKILQAARLSSVGEMAGTIAHEISNPLSIIDIKVAMLRESLAESEEGRIDVGLFDGQLVKLASMVERIGKIINSLRSLVRKGDGDPFQAVRISKIIDDTLELSKERFKSEKAILRVEVADDLIFECRPAQISQILLNLLGNSLDAVQDLSERWVSLEVRARGDKLEISVTDSGGGIPKETAEKMMGAFFTTKAVGKGTGLGLSISKSIAEEHHGTLRYEADSRNTRFVLELPLRQPGEWHAPRKAA